MLDQIVANAAEPSVLGEEAKQHLQECSRVVVFNQEGVVSYANCAVQAGELQQLAAAFGEREAAIQRGLKLEGRRYEVHRHHPPLVWGRSMADCSPEQSTGIAVCRVDKSRLGGGAPAYLAVTFEQPHTSAFILPRVTQFAKSQLAAA